MRRVLVAAAGGLLCLALAGCGAAQNAQTAQNRSAVAGVNSTEAGIAVRNATVPFSPEGYPAGGDAPIQMAMLNESNELVRLVEVTSPAAQSVTLAAVEPVRPVEPVDPEVPGAEEEPTGPDELALAPGEFVTAIFQASELVVGLDGASTVPIELTFSNQTELSLVVPIAPPDEPLPREEPLDVGHH